MTFEECLKRGKIKEFSQGKALVIKELDTAEHDLVDGRESGQQFKVIIQCSIRPERYCTRKITAKKAITA
ncbi:MAG: hypothetical protein ABIH74_02005 [Candidatus Omnitrophota bacterium]